MVIEGFQLMLLLPQTLVRTCFTQTMHTGESHTLCVIIDVQNSQAARQFCVCDPGRSPSVFLALCSLQSVSYKTDRQRRYSIRICSLKTTEILTIRTLVSSWNAAEFRQLEGHRPPISWNSHPQTQAIVGDGGATVILQFSLDFSTALGYPPAVRLFRILLRHHAHVPTTLCPPVPLS